MARQELTVATVWHDQERSRVEAVKAAHERDTGRLLDLLDTYVTYEGRKGARTSQRTRDSYATGARAWLAWAEENGVHLLRVERRDIQLWLAQTQERVSPGTAATYMAAVRALYRALVWAGATDTNPAASVRSPKDPRPPHERRDAIPTEGVRAMLELAEGSRDRLLLLFLCIQGLRISEVAALDLGDVRGGQVRVRNGKGGKARTGVLAPSTKATLAQWLDEREAVDGERALFVNSMTGRTREALRGRRMSSATIRRVFHRLREAAGLPDDLVPHSGRHHAGTRAYDATGNIQLVADFLGHSDAATSATYAKRSIKGLEDVMSKVDI